MARQSTAPGPTPAATDRRPDRRSANEIVPALDGAGRPEAWLWRPLLELLAAGEPVTIERVAEATGTTTGQVDEALAAMPDTEYDADGRVVGSGLTLRPTPHRFDVDGTPLYTWCALDTLIFPAVLGRPAQVNSPCRATGEPIRVRVEPDRVAVQPATAVVSIVSPEAAASVRASFCDHVHFFASAEVAQAWLDGHPGATLQPVADAYELGQRIADALIDAGPATGCC